MRIWLLLCAHIFTLIAPVYLSINQQLLPPVGDRTRVTYIYLYMGLFSRFQQLIGACDICASGLLSAVSTHWIGAPDVIGGLLIVILTLS